MIEIAPWSAEQEEIRRLANGRPVIMNCNLDLGIKLEEIEDGRVNISVDPEPLSANNPACKALRSMMEETAIGWLKIVAPHRLAYGANDT